MNNGFDREVSFEIVEHIGVLTTHSTGWSKQLNLVAWNGGQPKYDLRDWSPDYTAMSRGVTLNESEMRKLLDSMLVRKRTRRPLQERMAAAEEKQEQQAPLSQNGYEEAVER